MTTTVQEKSRQYYPALRGIFGDWVYYSCLMSMKAVTERLSFAEEIHKNKKLSDMIQRELKGKRSKDISSYLLREDQRFFNSLVVAIYGGDPAWHSFSNFTPQANDIKMEDVPEDVEESVGFLSFSGEEKIFAIDGQHRLAGMREALKKNSELGKDEVSLVLVAHQTTETGQERTRRLFSTLNKTAVPVGKGEIIALDENDAMAIVTRHLVENDGSFGEERIRFSQADSMPKDAIELTTIGNLYEILKTLFVKFGYAKKPAEFRHIRPDDQLLKKYIGISKQFFDGLEAQFPPFKEYFAASPAIAPTVVSKYRRESSGGHVLFRPVGLRIFAEVLTSLANDRDGINAAFKLIGKLPTELSKKPYAGVIWLANGKMSPSGRSICRRLLLHMLGAEHKPADLRARYAKLLGKETQAVQLPSQVI